MVLNFGGASKVLTVMAPYTCTVVRRGVGRDDRRAHRAREPREGHRPGEGCAQCGGKLEFDESPESYFAFVNKYAATNIDPDAAARSLAAQNLYHSR